MRYLMEEWKKTLTLKICNSSRVTSSVSRLFPLCRAMTFNTVPTSKTQANTFCKKQDQNIYIPTKMHQKTPTISVGSEQCCIHQSTNESGVLISVTDHTVTHVYLCQWTWHHTARPLPRLGPPRFVSACMECWLLQGQAGAVRDALAATSAGGCGQIAAPNQESPLCFQTLCLAGWWFYWGTGKKEEREVGMRGNEARSVLGQYWTRTVKWSSTRP